MPAWVVQQYYTTKKLLQWQIEPPYNVTPITTPHYVISADSSFDRCDRSNYTRIKSLCTHLSVFNRAISHNSQGIIGDRYK